MKLTWVNHWVCHKRFIQCTVYVTAKHLDILFELLFVSFSMPNFVQSLSKSFVCLWYIKLPMRYPLDSTKTNACFVDLLIVVEEWYFRAITTIIPTMIVTNLKKTDSDFAASCFRSEISTHLLMLLFLFWFVLSTSDPSQLSQPIHYNQFREYAFMNYLFA